MNSFRPDETIRETAEREFARLRGGGTVEQGKAFRQWLDCDPEHARAYAEVEHLWAQAGRLGADPQIQELRRSMTGRRPALRLPRLALGAVAVIALIATGGIAWHVFAPSAKEYATAFGEQRTVFLEDGSQIVLNTSTQISFSQSGRQRRVRMKHGEALFTVHHDAQRPFTVEIPGAVVTVLGTRFQMRADGARSVTLMEGRVSVAFQDTVDKDAGGTLMQPGERWSYDRRARLWIRDAIDPESATSWTRGFAVFDDAPLAEVVAEINRYSRHKLELADTATANLRVSGVFKTGDAHAAVRALERALPISARRLSDERTVLMSDE